mmetsp:Transcript_149/g.466  ORF Transcript_149/g.466 Transcript_149/m.466 type:complete len:727 (-) Transcript_149:174-2354(-)
MENQPGAPVTPPLASQVDHQPQATELGLTPAVLLAPAAQAVAQAEANEGLEWEEAEDVAEVGASVSAAQQQQQQTYSQLFHSPGGPSSPTVARGAVAASAAALLGSPLQSLTRALDFDRFSTPGSDAAGSTAASGDHQHAHRDHHHHAAAAKASYQHSQFHQPHKQQRPEMELERQSSIVEWLSSQPPAHAGDAAPGELLHFDQLPSASLDALLDDASSVDTGGHDSTSTTQQFFWRYSSAVSEASSPRSTESKAKGPAAAAVGGTTAHTRITPPDLVTDMVDVLVLGDETGLVKQKSQLTDVLVSPPDDAHSGSKGDPEAKDFNALAGIQRIAIPRTEQVAGSKVFQKYTVYVLEVTYNNGERKAMRRRFSDFVGCEKMLHQAAPYPVPYPLPECWRELPHAKKMFGQRNRTVIENRRQLLETCIQSLTSRVLHPNHVPIVQAFLTPELEDSQFAVAAKQNEHTHAQQQAAKQHQRVEPRSANVRLIVSPPGQHHSMAEQLAIQAGLCRGCQEPFPSAINHAALPILCEYTGEYFCSKCHHRKKCMIPSYAVHNWDFTPRPVWNEAKAYLDSTWDKPILCVNAINPYLYNSVPALSLCHDHRIRLMQLQKRLPAAAQSALFTTLGRRRYLAENCDFYAMSELAELSKSRKLNKWLESIIGKCERILTRLEKIQQHKAEQEAERSQDARSGPTLDSTPELGEGSTPTPRDVSLTDPGGNKPETEDP